MVKRKIKKTCNLNCRYVEKKRMEDQSKKELLIDDVKQEHFNLTSLDRRLLKAYFSYIDTKGLLKAKKKKEDCSTSIKNVLWPVERENAIDEDRPFELSEIKQKDSFISRIFEHTDESLTNLLKDGAERTENQQLSLIKLFQVSHWKSNEFKIALPTDGPTDGPTD